MRYIINKLKNNKSELISKLSELCSDSLSSYNNVEITIGNAFIMVYENGSSSKIVINRLNRKWVYFPNGLIKDKKFCNDIESFVDFVEHLSRHIRNVSVIVNSDYSDIMIMETYSMNTGRTTYKIIIGGIEK
mgnify:CR=1 FL=1